MWGRRSVIIGVVAAALVPFGAAAAQAADGGPTVRTGGVPLRLRTGPGTTYERIGALREGTRVSIVCRAAGERIHGRVSTSSGWDLLTGGGFVSDAYIAGAPAVPACAGSLPAAPAQFIALGAPLARTWKRLSGVPASVTLAQAALESGWGASALASQGHNLFGIKCFGSPGPIATGCHAYRTSECANGQCGPEVATFRTYSDVAQSFRDHDHFLRVNDRYAPAFQALGNADVFAQRLQQAGYATDPGYAGKLIALMHQYNLYQYDS